MEYLLFNEGKYHIREIEFDGNIVYITQTKLNDVLFDNNGQYVSKEAENIDEQIIFYLDEKQMKWSDKKIIKLLEEEIS